MPSFQRGSVSLSNILRGSHAQKSRLSPGVGGEWWCTAPLLHPGRFPSARNLSYQPQDTQQSLYLKINNKSSLEPTTLRSVSRYSVPSWGSSTPDALHPPQATSSYQTPDPPPLWTPCPKPPGSVLTLLSTPRAQPIVSNTSNIQMTPSLSLNPTLNFCADPHTSTQ